MAIVKIRPRRDTAADWTTHNPTLAEGEFARETNSGRFKFGDGSTPWTALAYWKLPWADITARPTTLAGYGITDAQPLSANLSAFSAKAAPTGDVVGTNDTQTLTNKTINGGSANNLTGLSALMSNLIVILDTPSTASGAQLSIRSGGTRIGQLFGQAGGPLYISGDSIVLRDETNRTTTRATIGAAVAAFSVPVGLPGYTLTTLPAPSSAPRGMIYVSNASGGAVPAYSDGTNWRRVTDMTIIN